MLGTLAQLVEQWTENPCVPGSIPGGTTLKSHTFSSMGFFISMNLKFPFECQSLIKKTKNNSKNIGLTRKKLLYLQPLNSSVRYLSSVGRAMD